jgi:hypothetical protein
MLIDRRTVIIGAAALAAVRTAESATPDTVEVQMNTPTERVLGIGGLFFRSRDPKKLAQWYQLHLGIDPVPADYGHPVWQAARVRPPLNPRRRSRVAASRRPNDWRSSLEDGRSFRDLLVRPRSFGRCKSLLSRSLATYGAESALIVT